MIVVIIIGVLMVFFAWLQSIKVLKSGLFISFAILFAFLALRYDYGNDYHGYMVGFNEINSIQIVEYFNRDYHYEAGWVLMCRIFEPFGFFSMIAFLALFNCWIYYRFIKKYVPEEYYWLAVFIYIFNPGYMLTQSSTMRQTVAISLFILAIDFIISKKIINYLLLIGLASLFHTSALVILPVYFVRYINVRLKWYWQVGLVGLFVFLFLFGQTVSPIINSIVAVNFEEYGSYSDTIQIGSGLGVLLLSFFLCLVLYWDQYQDPKNAILFKLSFISYLFIPLGLIISLISRIGMYFDVVNIAIFPLLYISLQKSIYKKLPIVLMMLFTLYNFYMFFQSPVWRDSFSTYKTIFSSSF